MVDAETVRVVGIPSPAPALRKQLVLVEWNDPELGVPLRQVAPLEVSPDTEEAIADWRYWLDR